MIRSLGLLGALWVVACSTATADDQDSRPSWKVKSLHVTKPDEADFARGTTPAGTRVIVRLELPGRQFIQFDEKKCKIDSFTDDKNSDLLAVPDAKGRNGKRLAPIEFRIPGAEARERANQLIFQAPGYPLLGATKVRVKGSVVAVVGKTEKEIEKKDFEVKAGVDLGFGTFKAQAARTGFGGNPPTSDFEKNRTTTSISYTGERPLKSVTFLDADGKEIPSSLLPSFGFRPVGGNKADYQSLVVVKVKELPRCTIRVKYFDATEEVTIPVDLEVGPGF